MVVGVILPHYTNRRLQLITRSMGHGTVLGSSEMISDDPDTPRIMSNYSQFATPIPKGFAQAFKNQISIFDSPSLALPLSIRHWTKKGLILQRCVLAKLTDRRRDKQEPSMSEQQRQHQQPNTPAKWKPGKSILSHPTMVGPCDQNSCRVCEDDKERCQQQYRVGRK